MRLDKWLLSRILSVVFYGGIGVGTFFACMHDSKGLVLLSILLSLMNVSIILLISYAWGVFNRNVHWYW